MLELVNRARSDPAAEGRRLLAIAQSDPVIAASVANWNLNTFQQQINAFGPLPPLAFNTRLIEAARVHNADMLAVNGQVHAPNGFLNNPAVATASDGQAYFSTAGASWATGENIFAYSRNVRASTPKDVIDYFEEGFLLDWGNPDFGHLKNILAPGPGGTTPGGHYPYSQIGIGLLTGATPTVAPYANAGLSVGPDLVTQEFAWKTGNSFLTGVAYRDDNASRFYEPGEGLGGVTIRAVGRNGEGTFQVQTWGSGGYSLPLPQGTYEVTAAGSTLPGPRGNVVTIGADNVEWDASYLPAQPPPTPTPAPAPPTLPEVADIPVPGDYDGLGRAEVAVYRPSTAQWIIQSPGGPRVVNFGQPGVDIPVTGDYEGVGKDQIGVFRKTSGDWFYLNSQGTIVKQHYGQPGDIPAPADFEGKGKANLAVFRPSSGDWFWRDAAGGSHVTHYGQQGDIPLPRDYDGDGKADLAVFRPDNATWYGRYSGGGGFLQQFGAPNLDIPLPRDYDGDGKADLAVFRPTTAVWAILKTSGGGQVTIFGATSVDMPVPANYSGRGETDIATFRTTNAVWSILPAHANAYLAQLGRGGESPTPMAWIASGGLTFGAPAGVSVGGPATPAIAPIPEAADAPTPTVAIPWTRPAVTSRKLPRPWDVFFVL